MYLVALSLLVIPGMFTLLFPSFRGCRWDPRLGHPRGSNGPHRRRTEDRPPTAGASRAATGPAVAEFGAPGR